MSNVLHLNRSISTKTMEIRPYLEEDFQAIADIYNESITKGGITMDCCYRSLDDIRSMVDKFDGREIILVGAVDDIGVIGWGIIKRYSDRLGYRVCCETSLYLSLSETNKGYGSRLQKAILQKVREFGYHHVVAKILTSNPESIDFHKKFGFSLVGIQKEIGFYRGKWFDVAIMQLILPEIPPYQSELA